MSPRRLFGVAAALSGLLYASVGEARDGARVFIVDDGERLRKFDVSSPLALGVDNSIWRPDEPIQLAALRDEVVAFQVVVEAGGAALEGVTVELRGLDAACPLEVQRFAEHFVHVTQRSFNVDRPLEALGWRPAARPPDGEQLGWVPDALIPIEALSQIEPGGHWRPYPLHVEPHSLAAVWVDLGVPRAATAGLCRGAVQVRVGERPLAEIPLEVEIQAGTLPYRPVSFLSYYALGELSARIGPDPAVERSLWQLMHAHHVDALADLEAPADVERLRSALDGSLFTEGQGYGGPGMGVPPAAVALGAYGGLGAPSPAAMETLLELVPRIPSAVEDVVLYAADEVCDSPLGPAWRRAIRQTPRLHRVRVAHSCARAPRKQDVDLVLIAADAFDTKEARAARALGQGVWVYNGALPRSGSLLMDAGTTSPIVNGWIAATHDIGRWFLWESTFWNDDNRGGRGPIDPFATAESFHNHQGDTALGDGLLVYPGAQDASYPAHSLGLAAVLPSMRLKRLRRGIEDAGYFALARARDPVLADAVADRLIPRCLDEVAEDERAPWATTGYAFAEARSALRRLIVPNRALASTEVRAVLEEGALARSRRVQPARTWPRWRTLGLLALSPVIGALAVGAARRRRRAR